MSVDAHAHVFRRAADDPERTVDAIAPAERSAEVPSLRATMAGVDRAVLLPLGPEDNYVAGVLASEPSTFRGIAVTRATELIRCSEPAY